MLPVSMLAMVRDAIDPLSRFLGGNAGKGSTADPIASGFPRLERHAEHRALSRPGMADDEGAIAPVRDVGQRVLLLAGKHEATLFGTRKRCCLVTVVDRMTLARSHRFGCIVQALFCLDNATAGEAVSAVKNPRRVRSVRANSQQHSSPH